MIPLAVLRHLQIRLLWYCKNCRCGYSRPSTGSKILPSGAISCTISASDPRRKTLHVVSAALFVTELLYRGLACPGVQSTGQTWPVALRQKGCPVTPAAPVRPCVLVAMLQVAGNPQPGLVRRGHPAGNRIALTGYL